MLLKVLVLCLLHLGCSASLGSPGFGFLLDMEHCSIQQRLTQYWLHWEQMN